MSSKKPTVYRQVTIRLRIQRGPGRPDLVTERAYRVDRGTGRTVFLDEIGKAEPTLVEFDEHCQVDVEHLLKLGAIEPWRPAKKAKKGKGG